MRRRAGLSLIETVLAVFVLLVVFIIFGSLFQWVLSVGRRGDESATAARLASNRLCELRDWAAKPSGSSDNFRAGAWSSLATPVEVEPGYQVSVALMGAQIYSPSSELELMFAQPREASNACKRVRIRVTWGNNRTYDLYSQLAAPPVAPKQPFDTNIVVTQSFGGTLAPGTSGELSAQARDSNDKPIDDLVYRWNVLPETGSGSLVELNRNGSRVKFVNDNPLTVDGSTLKVQVSASYRGIELQGTSATITVDGP